MVQNILQLSNHVEFLQTWICISQKQTSFVSLLDQLNLFV